MRIYASRRYKALKAAWLKYPPPYILPTGLQLYCSCACVWHVYEISSLCWAISDLKTIWWELNTFVIMKSLLVLFNMKSNHNDLCPSCRSSWCNDLHNDLVQPQHHWVLFYLAREKARHRISLLFMCVALDVLRYVVQGSVMTDGTSGSCNNEVHTGGSDSIWAVSRNALLMYI